MAVLAGGAAKAVEHPDDIRIVELACGEVGGQLEVEMQRHCLVCDECARRLRVLVSLREVFGLTVPAAALGALRGLSPVARSH